MSPDKKWTEKQERPEPRPIQSTPRPAPQSPAPKTQPESQPREAR